MRDLAWPPSGEWVTTWQDTNLNISQIVLENGITIAVEQTKIHAKDQLPMV